MTADSQGATPTPQPFDQADGVTQPADPEGRPGFLSDVIVALGMAAPEVVEEAVETSREVGRPPEDLLVEHGVITGEQLAVAIAERNGLPYVDLFSFRVDTGAARLIDSDTAFRYRALPIAVDAAGSLVVALADPMDALAVSDIGVITKSEVRTAVASEAGIDALLATLPPPKRKVRLSAHGLDGFAGGRAAEGAGGWSLSDSISSPQPMVTPDPYLEPPPPQHVPAAAAAAADVEGRIDALVAAALDRHLGGNAAGGQDDELAGTRDELARTQAALRDAREEADQARAELAALSARLEQLETRVQPPPTPVQSPQPHRPQEPQPSAVEARLHDHLARVMRELNEPQRYTRRPPSGPRPRRPARRSRRPRAPAAKPAPAPR